MSQTKRTKENALSLLNGYIRVNGCKALKDLRQVDDLLVLVKRGERYFTLKGETVDDLLDESEESGESLCRVLLKDFFALSDSQYWRIRKEFTSAGPSGVFVNEQDKSKFGIFVEVPGQEAWYKDKRVHKSALATFVTTTGLLTAGAMAWKRAQRDEQQKGGQYTVEGFGIPDNTSETVEAASVFDGQ